MRIYILILAVAVVALNPSLSGAEESSLFSEIDQNNTAFEGAFAAGDGEALSAMYTEGGSLLPPGQGAITGRDAIAGFWQATIDSGVARIDLITEEVSGHGDTAVEVSRFEMFNSEGALIASGKYIVIWKKSDGVWQLHRDMWNAGY